MSLDLTPRPVAAPRAGRILAHARMEAEQTLRNGEQLLLALVIPVGLLVGGLLFGARLGIDPRTWPASVLALAVWSTSFTSLAITTGFERRYGVLERLAATPLTRLDLLAGKALATATVAVAQGLVLAGVALALGWRPDGGLLASLAAAAAALLAGFVFANLALSLAGSLKAEVTLALANLVYLLGALAGLVLPASAYPAPLGQVLAALPTSALGEALRGWAVDRPAGGELLVLFAWALLAPLLAKRVFRWMS